MIADSSEDGHSLSDLTPEDYDKIFDMISNILTSYGNFAGSFGEIELEYGDYFNIIELELTPSVMENMISSAPEEVLRKMMFMLMNLYTIIPRISKLGQMSAQEKIEFGQDLKGLAEEFKRLKGVEDT